MNIVTQNEIVNELQEGLKNPNRVAIVKYTENQVNYGSDTKPNFEYCEEHNIPCFDIGRRGGAFAINKGDVGFGYVGLGLDNTIGETLYREFTQYLKGKGLNAEAVSNDILIDGYKVFGWASNFYKEYNAIFITCHFSMSVDLELINNVCTKPMNKIPKGLKEFGIAAEEVESFLIQFIKENI